MMTYADLRSRGIRHLEQMTGRAWTDFNAHDPGITLLEAICYALTDLAYRVDHDVPDLLADGGGDPYESLHSAVEILPTSAVTLADLRRLVLDVEGVKNAWIVPDTVRGPNGDPLAGLHRVVVDVSGSLDGTRVRADVARRVFEHRGLCEDITDIQILERMRVRVEAIIEIDRVDDPAVTHAAILDALAETISPTVPCATLDEMLAQGKTLDEILEGPALAHGFLTDAALAGAPRRVALHGSDLIRAVMAVPGVRAVTRLHIVTDAARDPWSVAIGPVQAPALDHDHCSITLRNAGVVVDTGPKGRRDAASPTRPGADLARALALPGGRDRRVGVYHSLQHHLPALYGVGELGLPAEAPRERRARAKQLQAYLLLFDQLMANHLAQLAHAKDLFSHMPAPSGVSETTYFARVVDEPRLGLGAVCTVDQSKLEVMARRPEAGLGRKHRFLNHLLARFAENLNDRHAAAGTADADRKLVRDKQAFLRDYPRLGRMRGTSHNFLAPRTDPKRSGLDQRLRLKLGLTGAEDITIVEHLLLRPGVKHELAAFSSWLALAEEARAVAGTDRYSRTFTAVLPGHAGRFVSDEFRQIVEQTLRAQAPAHLRPYVLWLDAAEWSTFSREHKRWIRGRSEHLASTYGVSLGLDPSLPAALRSTPLLQPGREDPDGTAPRLVDHGTPVDVTIEDTQEGGAEYTLRAYPPNRHDEGAPFTRIHRLPDGTDAVGVVLGTGFDITVGSLPAVEDVDIRVRVERALDATIELDAVLPLRVRADPGLGVEAAGSPLITHEIGATLVIRKAQASVQYSVYGRLLTDADLLGPSEPPTIDVRVPDTGLVRKGELLRVPAPPPEAWNLPNEYTMYNTRQHRDGEDLILHLGAVTRDAVVVVRAHKDHLASSTGDDEAATWTVSTDVQLAQAVVLLARPGPAPDLRLAAAGDKVFVSGGEEGVFYHLLDPATGAPLVDPATGAPLVDPATGAPLLDWTTCAPLGLPAYFHRSSGPALSPTEGLGHVAVGSSFVVREGEGPHNIGIGSLRVGRDFVLSRREAPPGANLSTYPQPTPRLAIDVAALPAERKVMVMAVRARTGVAWEEPRVMEVLDAPQAL